MAVITEEEKNLASDLVIIEEGAEESGAGSVPSKEAKESNTGVSVEQEIKPGVENDDDEDEHIESSDVGKTDEEREALRERRKLEKIDRKKRRDAAIERDRIERNFLLKRNEDLERRLSAQEQRAHTGDLSVIDTHIAKAVEEVQLADRVLAKAIEAGNGEDAAQAIRFRDQASLRAQQLAFQKQQLAQQAPRQNTPQISDITMHYAEKFLAENPWYDRNGNDEDSAIVLAVDGALAREGFNPAEENYWDELRKRAAKRIPDKFAPASSVSQEEQRVPRGGPNVGSGREQSQNGKQEFRISPERKKALEDMGVWDDPALRMKYVKRYAQYDKDAKGN